MMGQFGGDMQKHYKIILTEEQARVISNACEIVSRVMSGQHKSALDILPWNESLSQDLYDLHEMVTKFLRERKSLKMGVDGWTSSLGIANHETPEDAKIAFDIHQVIRHRIAWDNHVEGESTMYVSFDTPYLVSKSEIMEMELVEGCDD